MSRRRRSKKLRSQPKNFGVENTAGEIALPAAALAPEGNRREIERRDEGTRDKVASLREGRRVRWLIDRLRLAFRRDSDIPHVWVSFWDTIFRARNAKHNSEEKNEEEQREIRAREKMRAQAPQFKVSTGRFESSR